MSLCLHKRATIGQIILGQHQWTEAKTNTDVPCVHTIIYKNFAE
jgi:hypothetical protein